MTSTKLSVSELVEAVRAHAEANYNTDGWDYIVECWEDKDIAETIGGCTTARGAIAAVKKIATVWDDQRKDAEAEIF